ncbi:DUF2235 domain-containing protein [Thiothrix fructosivorans]|uniref:DUF2235 domain-containing protein n=2 Tax=Thiothrix fructosivorans TaxID=111770 RepID=A0ABS3ILD0_9GAMM|nr:DUF2235 domain-containing protein [Thiothrix fructosivorans]MBO0613811.1 DUF2235 domain-containing protein [Thiothrix fructosivorans]
MELSNKAQQAGVDVQERWFVGHHGAVGGGKHENRGLADITLTWMLEEAMSTGVGVDVEKILTH